MYSNSNHIFCVVVLLFYVLSCFILVLYLFSAPLKPLVRLGLTDPNYNKNGANYNKNGANYNKNGANYNKNGALTITKMVPTITKMVPTIT